MVFYILFCRLAMRRLAGRSREAVLALLNLAAVFYFLIYSIQTHSHKSAVFAGAAYFFIVIIQYIMMVLFAGAARGWSWLAFFTPIAFLICVRYLPLPVYNMLAHAIGKQFEFNPGSMMVGISYLAFRCCRLILEIQNGQVKRPGLLEYLNFSFFLPTMSVGPINTYANFRRGFAAGAVDVPPGRALLRCLVGYVKFKFLGGVFGQLTYSAFLLNGHPHSWIDLPIVMVFYFLYLYCNFSGFCDMAIGAAGLTGIPVLENFDHPFAARNIKDFWNRWHITLSQWMRDIVFAPLSKFLVRLMGPSMVNHAIALTITVVFLLVGIWHGVGWNYAIYGLIHALGLVANHYYTIGLKKWLGREGFKAYMGNRWIHAAAVGLTFSYCAASLLFFANTLPQIKEIFGSLR